MPTKTWSWHPTSKLRLAEALRCASRLNAFAFFVDHRFQVFRISFHGEDNRSLLDSIRRGGHRGNDLPAIGQRETHREGAIGTEFHGLALKGDARLRIGGAVDDQLGIELEPELTQLAADETA